MELLFVLGTFIVCMTIALISGVSMIIPLTAGFFLFAGLARHKGFSIRQIGSFAANSLKDSLIVIRVMLIIGCLIGLWRQSGTILVPWCIASSVPLSMLGGSASSLPFAFYLWLVPLCTLVVSILRMRRGKKCL